MQATTSILFIQTETFHNKVTTLSEFQFLFHRIFETLRGLKPGQNKKSQKIVQLHCFLNTFLQLVPQKKYSKNGAAVKCFGPSYFVTALAASRQDPLSFTMRGCIKGVFRQLKKLGEIVEEVGTHVSFSVDKRGPHSVFLTQVSLNF